MDRPRRALAFAIVIIVITVTYCAQSCFDLEAMKPECPVHHAHDCCKHQAPEVAVFSQAINSMSPAVNKYLPQTHVVGELRFVHIVAFVSHHYGWTAPPVGIPGSPAAPAVLRI
jgi:hypothetical protein